jgi:hypothetical protein
MQTLCLGIQDEAEKQLTEGDLAQADSHRQSMVAFLSDILFSAYFDVHVVPKQVVGLLRVTKDVCDVVKVVPPTDYRVHVCVVVRTRLIASHVSSRLQILYKLMLTFVAAVEPSHAVFRPSDGALLPSGNAHLSDAAAFSAIKAELDAVWGVRTSHHRNTSPPPHFIPFGFFQHWCARCCGLCMRCRHRRIGVHLRCHRCLPGLGLMIRPKR